MEGTEKREVKQYVKLNLTVKVGSTEGWGGGGLGINAGVEFPSQSLNQSSL